MAPSQVAAQSKDFGAASQTDLTGSLVSSVSTRSVSRAIHILVKIIKSCVQPPLPHPLLASDLFEERGRLFISY